MEKSAKLIDQIEIDLIPISRAKAKILRYTLYFLISFFIPLGLLLHYTGYAATQSTALESCCNGAGMSFGFLTGIIMALFMRFDSDT
jgi:hypothetical protein